MGRTVYGVDLEESPFGGLIEKLLTEEELEKLADGGVATGRDTAPDGGSDDEDADDWSVSDSTGYGRPDSTGDSEFGDAGFDDADAKDGGGIGSVLSTHKWLLLKVAVAFAVLAAVLVVVWRYRDKLAGVVPGRGGGDEFDVDSGGDADGDREPPSPLAGAPFTPAVVAETAAGYGCPVDKAWAALEQTAALLASASNRDTDAPQTASETMRDAVTIPLSAVADDGRDGEVTISFVNRGSFADWLTDRFQAIDAGDDEPASTDGAGDQTQGDTQLTPRMAELVAEIHTMQAHDLLQHEPGDVGRFHHTSDAIVEVR